MWLNVEVNGRLESGVLTEANDDFFKLKPVNSTKERIFHFLAISSWQILDEDQTNLMMINNELEHHNLRFQNFKIDLEFIKLDYTINLDRKAQSEWRIYSRYLIEEILKVQFFLFNNFQYK